MNTRIDGPGIAGTARPFGYVGPFYSPVWKITPDANHSAKPNSSTTPDKFGDWANWVQRENEKQHDAKVRAYYKAIEDEATQSAVNAATKPTPETGEATDDLSQHSIEYYAYKIGKLYDEWMFDEARSMLKTLLKEARERGEAKVCKRLPRLWGLWKNDGWMQTDNGPALAWSPNATPVHLTDQWVIREFAPMTGRPKA